MGVTGAKIGRQLVFVRWALGYSAAWGQPEGCHQSGCDEIHGSGAQRPCGFSLVEIFIPEFRQGIAYDPSVNALARGEGDNCRKVRMAVCRGHANRKRGVEVSISRIVRDDDPHFRAHGLIQCRFPNLPPEHPGHWGPAVPRGRWVARLRRLSRESWISTAIWAY